MRSTLKCDIIFTIIVGDLFMKTKIIYISGNETFEMTQIRAAFEEVRETLGLDKDTVLFGVPVDCDSALEDIKTSDNTITDIAEPVITEEISAPEIAPVETPQITEIVAEDSQEDTTDDVVPILSVLATNDDDVLPETVPVASVEISEPESIADDTEPVIADVEPETDTEIIDNVETVTVTEITDTEIPESPMEKTLEELLESMTPLREDVVAPDMVDASPDVDESADILSPDETDATLAQLATEFVQNEDKIPVAPKSETSGKIGKFKNILPFKKAKREDSGLMGDLFGWAGVAANDEDFSIPGFFTQAASKK